MLRPNEALEEMLEFLQDRGDFLARSLNEAPSPGPIHDLMVLLLAAGETAKQILLHAYVPLPSEPELEAYVLAHQPMMNEWRDQGCLGPEAVLRLLGVCTSLTAGMLEQLRKEEP